MSKIVVDQLAQLFVFGVRAIVASNTTEGLHFGEINNHLGLLQAQLDAILDHDNLPGHVVLKD